MSTVTTLNDIKRFLEGNVACNIKLQRATDNQVNNYELVNPKIFVGWIPPQGYLPEDAESSIPCIIVGMDEGIDDRNNCIMNIRLSLVVYSPGTHIPENEKVNYTPDFNGYNDLLNFLDLTKAEIIKNTIIPCKFILEDELKWGMYQEQPYPYWYGWITFSLKTNSYPDVELERMLRNM